MNLTDEMIAEDDKKYRWANVLLNLKCCGSSVLHDSVRFYAWLFRRTAEIIEKQQAEIELLKSQRTEIAQSEAEMMVEHTDGTDEYVKDIDSIMLLAHKDYHITYTGAF